LNQRLAWSRNINEYIPWKRFESFGTCGTAVRPIETAMLIALKFRSYRPHFLGLAFQLCVLRALICASDGLGHGEPTLGIEVNSCLEGIRVVNITVGSPCNQMKREVKDRQIPGTLKVGDIITHVNSKPVSTAAEVRRITMSEGDNAVLTVLDSAANFTLFNWNVTCARRKYSLTEVVQQENIKCQFGYKQYDIRADSLELFRLSSKWNDVGNRVANALANDLNLSETPEIWLNFDVLSIANGGQPNTVIPRFRLPSDPRLRLRLCNELGYPVDHIRDLPRRYYVRKPVCEARIILLPELRLKDPSGNPNFARIGQLFQNEIQNVKNGNGGSVAARPAVFRPSAVYVISSWQPALFADGKPAGRYCWRFNTWFRPSSDGKNFELSARIDIGKFIGANEIDEVTHSEFGGTLCQNLRSGIALNGQTKVVKVSDPTWISTAQERNNNGDDITKITYVPPRPSGISIPEAATALFDAIVEKLLIQMEP